MDRLQFEFLTQHPIHIGVAATLGFLTSYVVGLPDFSTVAQRGDPKVFSALFAVTY